MQIDKVKNKMYLTDTEAKIAFAHSAGTTTGAAIKEQLDEKADSLLSLSQQADMLVSEAFRSTHPDLFRYQLHYKQDSLNLIAAFLRAFALKRPRSKGVIEDI